MLDPQIKRLVNNPFVKTKMKSFYKERLSLCIKLFPLFWDALTNGGTGAMEPNLLISLTGRGGVKKRQLFGNLLVGRKRTSIHSRIMLKYNRNNTNCFLGIFCFLNDMYIYIYLIYMDPLRVKI